MTDFVQKRPGSKYYYKRDVNVNKPYVLKDCVECGLEAFIEARSVYCSLECRAKAAKHGFNRDGSVAHIRGRKPGGKTDFILAVDPGSTRTGYALYEHEGGAKDSVLLRQGIIHFDEVNGFLGDMTYITRLVYERYRIRPGGRQNVGSEGKVMQVIGKLDMWASSLGIPVSTQEPAILPLAAKIVGYPMPKSHLRDDVSAVLHGAYFLRGRGWYISALEREKAS